MICVNRVQCCLFFIDVTNYLRTYGMTAHELTMTMVRDVLYNTGITATAGIGTNLFLAKIAMDIEAKKSKPDKDEPAGRRHHHRAKRPDRRP